MTNYQILLLDHRLIPLHLQIACEYYPYKRVGFRYPQTRMP